MAGLRLGLTLIAYFLFSVVGACGVGTLPNVTHSGYLEVDKEDGSQIFYTYYEAQEKVDKDTPVLLWLQGGPGCAGQFGNFYELGPQRVNQNLSLEENGGAWNRKAGLLFVDQPVGTGFSPSGSGRLPTDEKEIAADMYVALLDFFDTFKELQDRPFVITGESYAGKYIPSIGHFIIAMERLHGLRLPSQKYPQYAARLPLHADKLGRPNFMLAGLAIGNGLTDPESQVQTHAATAFYQGLIDTSQRVSAMGMQLQVEQAIHQGAWDQASSGREALLTFLQQAIGCGTMLDSRRTLDYDSGHLVDLFLNQAEVKEHLGVVENITFVGCSGKVDKALAADIMKSVVYLVPDLLDNLPILLYQGAFDAQDGPATQEAWLQNLPWPGRIGFRDTRRWLWRAKSSGAVPHFHIPDILDEQVDLGGVGRVLGYWKEWDMLTHVVIRDAGHMVPRDDPLTSQAMIESWLERSVLSGKRSLYQDQRGQKVGLELEVVA